MDYLTITTAHTMIILSLCGIVYLSRQFMTLIEWLVMYTIRKNNDMAKKEDADD